MKISFHDANRHLSRNFQRYFGQTYRKAIRDGDALVCGDMFGSPGHSFRVNPSGAYAGKWRDFNGGEHGDLVDLMQRLRGWKSPLDVIRMLERDGMQPDPDGEKRAAEHRENQRVERENRRKEKTKYAREMYRRAGGTDEYYFDVLCDYFADRGFRIYGYDAADLRPFNILGKLQFNDAALSAKHKEVKNKPHRAMIHKVCDAGTDEFMGVHRIHLTGNVKYRDDDAPSKTMLGCIKGGGVWVNRVQKNGQLILGEGIENSMAWFWLLVEDRGNKILSNSNTTSNTTDVLAALSCNNMVDVAERVPIEQYHTIAICADPDPSGMKCAKKAYEIILDRGDPKDRPFVYLVSPTYGDANEVLVEKRNNNTEPAYHIVERSRVR